MDDGTRYRDWIERSPRTDLRPEPGRMLVPLLTVALTLATPLVLPIPVAVVSILAALAWLGARIQESGSGSRLDATLRTGSGGAPRSRDRRVCSGESR